MLCCQGAQNIGLSNHKLKSANVHRMITMHARPRQMDRWTYEQLCNNQHITH